MKRNSTAAKHIKKYCYIVGLISFLITFFVCSQMIRYQEKEKKATGTYMAQSTIRRVKAKLYNYITISDLLGNYIIDGSDLDENTFSELAEKIPNEEGVVKAFELAPEGIITESGSCRAGFLRKHPRGGIPLPSKPAALPPSPRGRLQWWRQSFRHSSKASPWGSWLRTQ